MAEANLTSVSGQGIATKATAVATLMAGKAYVWGGKTTDGFDCSGFVGYVFGQLFPNQEASYQLNVAGFAASDLFEDVTRAAAGDLIIFAAGGGGVAHIGIVLDAEQWVGCQSSTGVAKVKFTNVYWNGRSKSFRRLKTISTASISAGRGAVLRTIV